jgi:hypothetical protein
VLGFETLLAMVIGFDKKATPWVLVEELEVLLKGP